MRPLRAPADATTGFVRLALIARSRPIHAQVKLPLEDLPAQGVVALFTEKRRIHRSLVDFDDASYG
jgi:hypothetical protein